MYCARVEQLRRNLLATAAMTRQKAIITRFNTSKENKFEIRNQRQSLFMFVKGLVNGDNNCPLAPSCATDEGLVHQKYHAFDRLNLTDLKDEFLEVLDLQFFFSAYADFSLEAEQ